MLSYMDEQVLVEAFRTALEQSQATFGMADVILLVVLQITGMFALFFIFWRFILWKKNNEDGEEKVDVSLANNAHKICVTEDEYHQPIILCIPRLLTEFKEEVSRLSKNVETLANHNNDLLLSIMKHQNKRIP
jgi:hypothetical protein